MSEGPNMNEFEEHPDVRGLQGMQRGHNYHETLSAKLELFEASPKLIDLNDLPIEGELHIRSLSILGEEEEVRFRRRADKEMPKGPKPQYVLLQEEAGDVIELSVNLFGSCASPHGTLLEAGSIRKYAYFAYAVVFPLRFRHGSEVPDSPFAHYKTPEEHLAPVILEQYLAAGEYILKDAEGRLYWDEIDYKQPGAGERVTGQVISAEIKID